MDEIPKEEPINIELIYPLPNEQILFGIKVSPTSSVREAIELSGIMQKYPEIDLNKNKVGIYSKICKLDDSIREGDRIEIYRQLIADPKEARMKKVAAKK